MCTVVRVSTSQIPQPSVRVKRARLAVVALFFTNGALFANILPRYPEIKDMFGLTNSVYGITIAMFPVGAILAALASGSLIRRFGSANVAAFGMIGTAVAFFLAGSSPNVVLFGITLLIAGGVDAISDVGQNAHAMQVQKAYKRSIINSFHAIWSIGAVSGGAMSALAITIGLSLSVHLGIIAAVFSIVSLVARAHALPERDERSDEENVADPQEIRTTLGAVSPKIVLMLAALVLISVSGAVIEEVGNSWAALYLGDSLGASAQIAAFGFIALVGGQFVGRILGDSQVDRRGNRRVALIGGLLTAIGMSLALAFPTIPGTLAGFAAAGYGSATLIPSAFDRADKLPGLREGTGIAIISWLSRIGYLASPPIIGYIADSASLRMGLLILPAIGIVVMLSAGVLPGRETAVQDGADAAESAQARL